MAELTNHADSRDFNYSFHSSSPFRGVYGTGRIKRVYTTANAMRADSDLG